MKKISAIMIIIFLLICQGNIVYAVQDVPETHAMPETHDVPELYYELRLTDKNQQEITDFRNLSPDSVCNLEILLTRTDIPETYPVWGVEFQIMTDGLAYRNDGVTFHEEIPVNTAVYSDGLNVGFAWLDLNRKSISIDNPVSVCRWSYAVTEPENISLRVSTAVVYISGYPESIHPQAVNTPIVFPTPTVSPTPTPTASPMPTPTASPMPTPTPFPVSWGGSSRSRRTASPTPMQTPSGTVSPVPSGSVSPMPSLTPSSADSPELAQSGTVTFNDVPQNMYYYSAVQWAAAAGITNGRTNDTFDPDGLCTRAHAVTFLWRAWGSPEINSGQNPFTDIDADAYYASAVRWAVQQGITNGRTDSTFDPNGLCTRAHMVTFLWRAWSSPEADSGQNPFTDIDADTYYASAVRWAVQQGITNGKTASIFDPDGFCTRAHAVTFLYRMISA